MKTTELRFVNLGVLALPIFCCLVGALLILTLNEKSGEPLPMKKEEMFRLLAHLQSDNAALVRSRELNTTISNRIVLLEYRASEKKINEAISEILAAKSKLTNEVSEDQILQGRLEELNRQIDASTAEVAVTRARLEELRKRVAAAATNDAFQFVGTNAGSMILLECDARGAVMHPGSRRLDTNATAADLAPVFAAIDSVGFVALVARPSGFEKSFDHFQQLVFTHLDEMNQRRGKPIGRCSFPLAEDAPLTAFVTQ